MGTVRGCGGAYKPSPAIVDTMSGPLGRTAKNCKGLDSWLMADGCASARKLQCSPISSCQQATEVTNLFKGTSQGIRINYQCEDGNQGWPNLLYDAVDWTSMAYFLHGVRNTSPIKAIQALYSTTRLISWS